MLCELGAIIIPVQSASQSGCKSSTKWTQSLKSCTSVHPKRITALSAHVSSRVGGVGHSVPSGSCALQGSSEDCRLDNPVSP